MSLKTVFNFISYWYFRYLMVTELYMVEKWERNVINSTALLLFFITWYLNANYLVNGISNSISVISDAVFEGRKELIT